MAAIIVKGPLFDGTADAAVTQWLEASRKDLADKAADALRTFPMNKTGRARGGFQSSIHVRSEGLAEIVPGPKITGVAWSPWLEGTSHRNSSTRFKGYHLFRKTRTKIRAIAKQRAQEKLDEGYLQRMGGQ